MRRIMVLVVLLVGLGMFGFGSAGSDRGLVEIAFARSAPVVRWEPEEPVQGTAFVVSVIGGLRAIEGTAAGEPLHFFYGRDGGFQALAAAPLDRGDSMVLHLELQYADGRTEKLDVTVPVAKGDYVMERLTVDPQFVTPTDTVLTPEQEALAARQARDREKASAISVAARTTPRMWDKVVLPRESRITSPFGTGRELNGRVQSRHTGVDFAGAVGAPVHAAAAGIVAVVDSFHLAGNVVYINHGGGLVTGYFHLSEALVNEGDRVEPGDVIAKVGATGRVTGPHLHWQVRYGAVNVDGMSLLEAASLLAP